MTYKIFIFCLDHGSINFYMELGLNMQLVNDL